MFARWFDTIPAYQSNLELILCEGACRTRCQVRSRICSHLVVAYGSTEASMTAAAPAHEIVGTPGAVGFVTPGTAGSRSSTGPERCCPRARKA